MPFGGNFDEFILPFINEMKKLEQGTIMKVNGQDAWVIAGLGVVTADLSQGNDLIGVKWHNAFKGCHLPVATALVQSLESHTLILNKMYQQCQQLSILDELKRERHLQTPQDIYYATTEKTGRFFNLTCELFSKEGESDFIKSWKDKTILKKIIFFNKLLKCYIICIMLLYLHNLNNFFLLFVFCFC